MLVNACLCMCVKTVQNRSRGGRPEVVKKRPRSLKSLGQIAKGCLAQGSQKTTKTSSHGSPKSSQKGSWRPPGGSKGAPKAPPGGCRQMGAFQDPPKTAILRFWGAPNSIFKFLTRFRTPKKGSQSGPKSDQKSTPKTTSQKRVPEPILTSF